MTSCPCSTPGEVGRRSREKSHINFYEGAMELDEIGSRIAMAKNHMNELELCASILRSLLASRTAANETNGGG